MEWQIHRLRRGPISEAIERRGKSFNVSLCLAAMLEQEQALGSRQAFVHELVLRWRIRMY